MPEWLDKLGQEWPVITAAPISLSIAVVAIIVIVWAISHWFYRRRLSSKNIQIEMLRGWLADYRNVLEGASPSEAAYKITQLKAQLEAIKGVPLCRECSLSERKTYRGSGGRSHRRIQQVISLRSSDPRCQPRS